MVAASVKHKLKRLETLEMTDNERKGVDLNCFKDKIKTNIGEVQHST